MHIPDGFLATPVWATLDAAAIPATGFIVRRAQREFDEARIPLLGVMGAFVFAAQMINFPVGIGTTGHLVGGALLAFTLGPAAASVVMAAILTIQALVFQDGGILALGPNVVNMAILGVLAGYLPFYLWGGGPGGLNGRRRKFAIFAGGTLSVLVSAVLALSELMISGVKMPASVLSVSLALFLVSGLLEGAITLAVIQALESIQPGFIRRPAAGRSYALGAVSIGAVLLAAVGVLFASTAPDGIEKLSQQTGIASQARTLISTPLSGYEVTFLHSSWLSKTGAGLAGLALIYAACLVIGRAVARNRSV
ncbi:Cobalamin (Vitamin B12) biosynthesis CbiM protein [Candidatus Sulfopaludibacter sp. SbA4]|nr:Cobalamin (Vitamin B12) biosynthesis CbiM protein [Candidatus Sulfopaludibacter sp. SbA4]